MSQLLKHITQTFDKNSWAYQQVENALVIKSGFEAHHTKVELHLQAFEPMNAVSVVSQSPILQPGPDHRAKTAEMLMRVNQTLNVGSFEMNWDQAETIFRVTNVFPEGQFDPKILTMMVEATVVEMDRLTPFLSVVSKSTPAELIALDIPSLLKREELLPDVGAPENKG